MAILMTGLCEKGVELIWKQCNEELYPQGIEYLEEAAHAGDAEGWFFLGNCYSWGDGAVGFSDKKAYECYKKGIEGGSVRCVLGAARAGQFDEELKKASPCTLEESYRAVLQSAEEGDAFSAFQIAAAYEWEAIFDLLQPEEQKRENCYKWYEQAAKGGIVSAMVKVGKCCLNGQYVPKNEEMALKWADRCAALGNAWGLYRMGLHHLNLGNMEAAWEYFEAAAKQGALKAFLHLGRMYLIGQGTERDIGKAVEALEQAAKAEEPESFAELGNIFYRDEVVERDDEKAFYWYSRAYAAGQKQTALPLAHLYLRASEIQDLQMAEKLFKEAADMEKDGCASLVLGNMSRDGIGGIPDIEQAVSWYEKGADMGNAECMEILGCLYFQGEDGLDTDYVKAFSWLDQCHKAGTLQSYSKLAFLYMKGYGCDIDEERARELFEKAAETECDGYAFYELGYLYERKNESPEDLEKAAQYYRRAVEMGNESAGRRFSHFKKGMFGKWKVIY